MENGGVVCDYEEKSECEIEVEVARRGEWGVMGTL